MKKTAIGLPRPPASILDQNWLILFMPDKSLWQWVIDNLISESSPLHNPDHAHLADANVGFLWTNTENSSKGRQVIGQCEELIFRCGKWQKYRQILQMSEWFGDIPEYLITLDANYCAQCSDTELLALIEHEIYHIGQAVDDFGVPKFNRETGAPSLCIRGHDVEEFIGVVRRYGVGQPDGKLAQLVLAANRKPEITSIDITKACGTCIA